MRRNLPPVAVLLGLAGLIPFVVTSVGAVGGGTGGPAMLLALTGYGAVILGFLGGVHWGLVLGPTHDDAVPAASERTRLALGVLPALIGWVALLTPLLLPAGFALLVLIAGFLLTALQETRWSRQGLLPAGYIWLRWLLTGIVVALLTTVFVVRLFGGAVIT